MIGNRLLIDTNIIVDIFNGNKLFADKINESKKAYISAIVLGELYVGVNRVSSAVKHLKMLQDFLNLCEIINADYETARIYGSISAKLLQKGKPIPTNDIWIAATAIQHDFTLITSDSHFIEIEDLKISSW